MSAVALDTCQPCRPPTSWLPTQHPSKHFPASRCVSRESTAARMLEVASWASLENGGKIGSHWIDIIERRTGSSLSMVLPWHCKLHYLWQSFYAKPNLIQFSSFTGNCLLAMLQLPGHDCAYNLCHQGLQLYSTCVPSDPSVKLAVCTTEQFNSQYVAQTDKMLCQTKSMDFQTGLVYICT